jgi:UDP-N-acetylmuramoylalanine--D-glutamate ligase
MNADTVEFSVEGARVVVVGAARSGVAAAELIARRGGHVVLTDVRETIAEAERLKDVGVTFELGGHRAETLASAELIVLSPGVSPRLPVVDRARQRGVPVISEVELASRWLRGRIVAVTGTKGKSTTSVLTGRILEAAGKTALVGGNVGTALSRQVEQTAPDVLHVVETSSFQLELTETFRPWIAVFLNLSPDHLDRHVTFDEYAEAKARIFANQTSSDAMVINADDPQVLEIARRGRAKQVLFGMTDSIAEGVTVTGDQVAYRSASGDRSLLPLSSIRVRGRHLLSDVLAAVAVGTVADASSSAMHRAVQSFTGLAHTLETVGDVKGVGFVNDSKATNIAAARAAIECFDDRLVVIMGGQFKGGDLSELVPSLSARATAVVAIGEARTRLREAFGAVVSVQEADTMGEAVRLAFAAARPGGTVLLAPACASFDMFSDYAERGGAFKTEVERLAAE